MHEKIKEAQKGRLSHQTHTHTYTQHQENVMSQKPAESRASIIGSRDTEQSPDCLEQKLQEVTMQWGQLNGNFDKFMEVQYRLPGDSEISRAIAQGSCRFGELSPQVLTVRIHENSFRALEGRKEHPVRKFSTTEAFSPREGLYLSLGSKYLYTLSPPAFLSQGIKAHCHKGTWFEGNKLKKLSPRKKKYHQGNKQGQGWGGGGKGGS